MARQTYSNYSNCFDSIKLVDLISDNTIYGLIWNVIYKHRPCALKIVLLESEVHRSSNIKYYDGNKYTYSSQIYNRLFNSKDFVHKKSMNEKKLLNEVDNLMRLSKLMLSPKVHDFGIYKKYDMYYGFILMDKTDSSLKDILHYRNINKQEHGIICEKINKLHNLGFIHNDLKPSNIGVYLDNSDLIYKCRIFDCSKVKFYDNIYSSKFKSCVEKDWRHYYEHVDKNNRSKIELNKKRNK